jgi:dihydroorotase
MTSSKLTDILIDEGKIIAIDDFITAKATKILDINGATVIPGAVDVHVHLREPGFEHKETIKSGTLAAAKGGVTTLMAMPNTKPVIDSMLHLEKIKSIIKKDAQVRVFPYASVTIGEKGQEVTDIKGLAPFVKGFSDDGVGVGNLDLLRRAMISVKQFNGIIASHAEVFEYVSTPESEVLAIRQELELVREIGCRYHFCHVSLKESFELIARAQSEGLDVTCEVTPHHILLCADDVCLDTNKKMNPPLRSIDDVLATRRALLDGVATIIATDHAPHTPLEKSRDFASAPNGVIGLETLVPLIYTEFVYKKQATLSDMVQWISINPAKRFDLPCGELTVGGLADLSVIDTESSIYSEAEIVSLSKNSPFIGHKMYGKNILTLVAGEVKYVDNKKVKAYEENR